MNQTIVGLNGLPVWQCDGAGNTIQTGALVSGDGIVLTATASPPVPSTGAVRLYSPDGEGISAVDTAGRVTVVTGGAQKSGPDWLNVKDFLAAGDNVTDDTAAIQAAINACPLDGVVYFPVGQYRTTTPLLLPPGVTLMGEKQLRPRNSFGGSPNLGNGVYISPRSTFSGAAVILVQDAQSGGWATMAQGSRINGIYLNCNALPNAGGIDGIRAVGQVQGLVLEDVSVSGASGYCFNFALNASAPAGGPLNPFSLRVRNCFATGGGTATTVGGFFLYNCTDSTFIDCEAIAAGATGWTVQGGANSHFIGCRGENHSGNGWTFGTTSGGTPCSANLVGCGTNGNGGHGFSVTTAQTVTLTDCVAAGEGATSAGFNIAAAAGVVSLSNCVSPSGATSQYGLQIAGSNIVSVDGGLFYGTTAGFNDGGTNTNIYFSPNVVQLTGTAATPTATVGGAVQTTETGVVQNATTDVILLNQANTATSSTGFISQTHHTSASVIMKAKVVGDTNSRVAVNVTGSTTLGSGAATGDTTYGRTKANQFGVTTADLAAATIGRGLQVAEGSNAKQGTVTLVAGSSVVANTAVTANSRIFLTSQVDGGTPGFLRVSARTAGTSFTITSSNAADISTVAYEIFEPA